MAECERAGGQARTRRTPTRPAGASRRACAARPPPRAPRLPTQARPSAPCLPACSAMLCCLQCSKRAWPPALLLYDACSQNSGRNLTSMQTICMLERLTAPVCAIGPVGIAKAAAAAAAGGTGGQAAAAAPGAAAEAQDKDAGAAAPDPASIAAVDNWDAGAAGGPARELLRRFAPLGASDCPLFGRKFAAPDNGVDLARAAHFMARDGAGAGVAPAHRRVLWFD